MNNFNNKLENFVEKIGQGIEQGVDDVGVKVFEAYERNMPTDTGETLSQSYKEADSTNNAVENVVRIGNKSPVGTYIEFGTGLKGEGTYKGVLPSWVTYRQTPWRYHHRYYGDIKTFGQVARQPLTNAMEEVKPNMGEIIASNIRSNF